MGVSSGPVRDRSAGASGGRLGVDALAPTTVALCFRPLVEGVRKPQVVTAVTSGIPLWVRRLSSCRRLAPAIVLRWPQ
jgi:hypothetical protein